MKLRVLNLPRTTTEAELKELFDPFGKVISCTVVLDKATGMSKGFGFVEIDGHVQGTAAIACLNDTRVEKNKIRVKAVEDNAE